MVLASTLMKNTCDGIFGVFVSQFSSLARSIDVVFCVCGRFSCYLYTVLHTFRCCQTHHRHTIETTRSHVVRFQKNFAGGFGDFGESQLRRNRVEKQLTSIDEENFILTRDDTQKQHPFVR